MVALKPARTQPQIDAFRAGLGGLRAAVVGAGRSGTSCVQVLAASGASVILADKKSAEELPEAAALARWYGAEFLPHFEEFDQLPDLDLIVISPGIPDDHPALVEARAAGIEVIGEVELAFRLCPAPIIAVTGTNGKGTCCRVMADMFERGGVPHLLAGNIGDPLANEIPRVWSERPVVLEVSSFQLESIAQFRPSVAIALNVTPDHLDRHPDFESYVAAKARLFENQTSDDFAIANVDAPICTGFIEGSRARGLGVSASREDADAHVADGSLILGDEPICGVHDFTLAGEHHIPGLLAAGLVARMLGVEAGAIAEAIQAYRPPPHHMELVAEVGGVVFYNDSKASNVTSAVADLGAMRRTYVAIAGGKVKEPDFSALGELLSRQAKGVILIGEAADAIEQSMSGATQPERADTLEAAVGRAFEMADPGDAVIMAPACSSFDMFDNYAHRGTVFRDTVLRLRRQHSQH